MKAFEFNKLEWQEAAPGARFKAFQEEGKQVRLVEFTSDFVEIDWCEKAHVGYVLSGELEVQFKNQVVRYPEGSALIINQGENSGHKARSVTPVVRLFLVEGI